MDRISIIGVVVCIVVIVFWSFVLVPKLYPPKPIPPGVTNAPPSTLTATNPPTTAAPPPPMAETP
ncbi:MAG: hypothetical protein DME25_17395, partial [Verrucomicrobia bacterium]